jgi:hypothetical protein
MRTRAAVFAVLFASSLFVHAQQGCASLPKGTSDIAGTYADDYGMLEAISTRFWVSGSMVFEICSIDNAKKRIVAFNNTRNQFGQTAGKFSAFDWTTSDGKLWYCQIVYDAPTEAAASSAAPANPQSPAANGCGQFEWSLLIRILPSPNTTTPLLQRLARPAVKQRNK